MVLVVACTFAVLLGILGFYENRKHQRNIDVIPLRINVNGVRGKSTVTRLVTGILMEAGYQTVGKTTGTTARMIYGMDHEEPIVRRLEGPNIREQTEVVRKAAQVGSEALVSECMAVNPDLQKTFQKNMLQANLAVIVNVLEDHMDVMGPTVQEVAEAFSSTIPSNGYLVVNQSEFVPYFKDIAEARNTKVLVCDPSRISESYLSKFDYMVFPENAALALAVADALGIDEKTALQGMLKVNPDPGAMRVLPLGEDHPSYFVNGFAANDATSTINIWNRVKELGYPSEKPVVVMNAREDRLDRTEQFANEVLPELDIDTLIAIGEGTSLITRAYKDGVIAANDYIDLEGQSTEAIMDALAPYLHGRTIYGVGNIHGAGEPLVEALGQSAPAVDMKIS